MSSNSPEKSFEKVREMIRQFPMGPGLYFMKDAEDKVLYIGKAKNLRSRAGSYFQPGAHLEETRGAHIEEMIRKVARVDYLETASEVDAILQEARLIKDIHPPYNTDLKDAKTFPYLEITTREPYPGVYVTRKPKNPHNVLFGPFTAGAELRGAVHVLQKIYKFRTCNLEIGAMDGKRQVFRPCLLYHIKQCTAPCADKVSKEDYRKQIRDLIRFLKSKRSTVLRNLQKQMEEAAGRQDYEAAAMYRDRIKMIESLDKRGSVDKHIQPEAFAADPTEGLSRLQQLLKSESPVRIIEGFDIATWRAGSGRVEVQLLTAPVRDGYGAISQDGAGGDDYASLPGGAGSALPAGDGGRGTLGPWCESTGGSASFTRPRRVFVRWGPSRRIGVHRQEGGIILHSRAGASRCVGRINRSATDQYFATRRTGLPQAYHTSCGARALLEE